MRYPVVSGAFYTSDKNELAREVDLYIKNAKVSKMKEKIVSAVVPHAGYMYSGWVAAYAYASIANSFEEAPVFVIISPNHTGTGRDVALSKEDWITPFGKVENNIELGEAIQRNSKLIEFDETAHLYEHSIEVQLPFLQRLYTKFSFVPITILNQTKETADDVSRAVFLGAKEMGKEVLLLASSDFTHYESVQSAMVKDRMALSEIEKLDVNRFFDIVMRNHISICGYGAIGAGIVFSKLKNANSVEIVKYANSGDITGDYSSVVAYASIIFKCKE